MSFLITHESNDLSEYTNTNIVGTGAVSTSAVSAMESTNYGLQSTVLADSDAAVAYLDYSSFGGTQYIISFWFDPNSISMITVNPTDWNDEDVTIFRLAAGATGRIFIELQYNGSNYVIRCCIRDDSLSFPGFCTGNITIFNEPQLFQISVTKATDATSNDGSMVFSINGLVKSTVSNLDLFTSYSDPNRIRIGLDDIVGEANISGTCYYDQIFGGLQVATAGKLKSPKSFIDDQGAGAAGGAGGGSGGNEASISADGLYIYISTFNSLGFPALIKIAAALNADGSVVFEPGAGGRIGVQCGKFDADTVWIAGQFDGTNVVEKSTDGGTSFTVKDNGSTGTVRTFEVGPTSDNRVIIFDGDNADILETVDDGVIWTTINSSVTPSINSISRFDSNVEEIAVVNQGGASNSVNYSVNSGANLEDYQTGVYPNADGTKVITV